MGTLRPAEAQVAELQRAKAEPGVQLLAYRPSLSSR
jgi:hypothetical protein